MTTKLRAAGLAVLREQRLRVLHADAPADETRPKTATCLVRSSRGTGVYAVDLTDFTELSCTCWQHREPWCSHRFAAALVLAVPLPEAGP